MNLIDSNFPEMPLKTADWSLDELSLSDSQKVKANELRTWLCSQNYPLATAIAFQQTGVFSDEEMRALESRLIQNFKPIRDAEKMQKILCKVIDAINSKTQTKLPLPRIPIRCVRPKNPLHDDFVKSLSLTRAWRDCVTEDMLKSANQDINYQENYLLGRFFTSVVLFGGLVNKSLLVALCKSLDDVPNTLSIINNRLVIELSIAWQGEPNSEHRIWFPDALSATLMAKLPDNILRSKLYDQNNVLINDKEITKIIWRWVLDYLKTLNSPNFKRPKNLNHFLTTVKDDLHYWLKPVVANFACRNIIAHAPPVAVVKRIFGYSNTLSSNTHLSFNVATGNSNTFSNHLKDDLEDLEPIWLSKLRQALNSTSHEIALDKIDALKNQLTSDEIQRCFHEFARHLVTSKSASGNLLAVSTARKYLVTSAKLLSSRLDGLQLATLDVYVFEDIYTDILECCNQDNKSKSYKKAVARALREFHHFLTNYLNIDAINVQVVLGIGKGLIPVDANLINIDEFEAIYDFIPEVIQQLHSTLPGQQKLIQCAQLIFMLSFRCGLRRMEVLKLKINDLSEAHSAVLMIRPSHARRLKTKSSTRNLPLSALLSNDEIIQLVAWKKQRLIELGNHSSTQDQFLFSVPELGSEFISQDTLFPIIHAAMRKVTQDETLRFHHLRHSFATWTFLRLMLSDFDNIPTVFAKQSKTLAFLEASKSFRKKLYECSGITRRHAIAVGDLLGHSGPDISLEHYIHCCDLLLNIGMQHQAIAPNESLLRQLSDRPQSTAYRWQQKGIYETPYRLLRKRWRSLFVSRKKIVNLYKFPLITQCSTLKELVDQANIFDVFHQLLFQHEMHKTPLADLANDNNIPLDDLQSVHMQMCEIRDMKIDRGSKYYRHRMIDGVMDRSDPNKNLRLACPVAPHMQQDIEIVNMLAPKIIDAIKTDPDLCRKVFAFYVKNAWKTRNELVFKDKVDLDNAKQFIEFMSLLGIKKSSLQFISFDISQRSSNLAKWRADLGLTTRDHVKKAKPPREESKNAKKWFGIKPIFNCINQNGSNQKDELQGSIAFRYLMVMGSVLMDIIAHHF